MVIVKIIAVVNANCNHLFKWPKTLVFSFKNISFTKFAISNPKNIQNKKNVVTLIQFPDLSLPKITKQSKNRKKKSCFSKM